MKDVRIDVKKLLETLKENLKKHQQEFAVAQEQYRKDLVEFYSALATKLKDPSIPLTDVRFSSQLSAPIDNTDSYQRIITMLEWSTEPIIEFDAEELHYCVNDAWSWRAVSKMTNATYVSKANLKF